MEYLAAGYAKLANLCTRMRIFDQADLYFGLCISIHAALETEENVSVISRRELGSLYFFYGNFLKEKENFQEAEKYYNKSLAIYKEIIEKYNIYQAREAMGTIYYSLGCLGDGNLYALEQACQIMKENIMNMADYDKPLSTMWSNALPLSAMRADAKKRIKAIRRKELKAKIISKFCKKK